MLPPPRRHATIPSSDFEFDRVLGPSASQSDVYHAAVKPIVEDVLNGWGLWGGVGRSGAYCCCRALHRKNVVRRPFPLLQRWRAIQCVIV